MPKRPQLERDISRLAALQLELRTTLDRVDRTLKRLALQEGAPASAAAASANRPVRVQILDILQELGAMAYTREITAYALGRYDLVVPPSRFGSLANDEQEAYSRRDAPRSRNRTLWLCFGLRHDDAAPVKRLLARSDWPLEQRIWAPTSGRVQHLRMVARLCELAVDEENVKLANADVLYDLIQTYARNLPVKILPGAYPFAEWQERALELLREDDLEARDYDLRQQAAERWSGLAEAHQLFGRELSHPPTGADRNGKT